jgi:hypothetical protein
MKRQINFVALAIFSIFIICNETVAETRQYLALVIGNSDYETAPLKNPVNDASDIAKALQDLGFKVELKTNADQRTMEQAIRSFAKELQKGGVGLFYYAGHGLQVSGINYLVPIGANINAEPDVKYESVDATRVLSYMEDAGNKLNIVILDACRDNPFARSFRSYERGLAKMEAPTGAILAYATAPGSTASDGPGRNGLYTSKILKYIKTPDLELGRLFRKIRIDVVKETGGRQVPWESSSLMGDFYFLPKMSISVSESIEGSADSYKREDKQQDSILSKEKKEKQQETEKISETTLGSRLFIITHPAYAKIRILNTESNFYQGIELGTGDYHIEVSARGYKTHKKSIKIDTGDKNQLLDIVLIPQEKDIKAIKKDTKISSIKIVLNDGRKFKITDYKFYSPAKGGSWITMHGLIDGVMNFYIYLEPLIYRFPLAFIKEIRTTSTGAYHNGFAYSGTLILRDNRELIGKFGNFVAAQNNWISHIRGFMEIEGYKSETKIGFNAIKKIQLVDEKDGFYISVEKVDDKIYPKITNVSLVINEGDSRNDTDVIDAIPVRVNSDINLKIPVNDIESIENLQDMNHPDIYYAFKLRSGKIIKGSTGFYIYGKTIEKGFQVNFNAHIPMSKIALIVFNR